MKQMNKWLLCTGPDWYRPSVTSTRQIAYQFHATGYKVLWVNPVAFKSPSVNSSTKKSRNKKILNKLFTHIRFFARPQPGFYVMVPFYFPLFGSKWKKINDKLIGIQVQFISLLLGIKFRNTILWISGSFTLSSLLHHRFKMKVYQAADVISEFRTNDADLLSQLKKQEIHLCNSADHIFASSPNIKQKLKALSAKRIHLLTHGVNFDHFSKPRLLNPFMLSIKEKGLPIAGYYGTLSDANDKEVFKALAGHGFSVVIIGKVLGDYSTLQGLENIYFTGPISFDELPSYAQGFDVCLLNWIMANWITNSFPVKTLEYLAMGKPIVSCPIPVIIEMFEEVVYFANTPQQFVKKSVTAIDEDNPVLAAKRMNLAREHTWENKFRIIEETIG
ncbi:MAG TPA: hypothetical protein DCL86_07645 [Bacteroidales bacterium]|jgi:glycosyltransferase involved in cell wall biosynthesis|nr:hypothetical protein [Bacteroidales bacterium]